MLRLLYSLHRRSAGQWHWLRRRFTRPGLVVLGAAVVLGTQRVRQQQRVARKQEHKIDLHEWEGEGGNLAPVKPPVVAAL